jgi:hypothetical protein
MTMKYDLLLQKGRRIGCMARSTPPSGQPDGNPPQDAGADSCTKDVELLRVLVSRKGTHVDAQWAIHPQLKQDLLPQEWQEVTDLMAKVTGIVGTRFSQVLTQADPEPPSNA